MKSQNDKPQSPVSMPVLIFGGIALVVLIYLFLQPTGSGGSKVSSANIHQTPSPVANQNVQQEENVPLIQSSPASSTDPGSLEVETLAVSSVRDPFLPSQIYIKSTTKTANSLNSIISQTNSDSQPIKAEVTPIPITVVSPSPTPTPTPEMVWKGLISTKEDQIVLINYNQKSYTLRLGDKVPTTNYIVADLNPDNVVLISPKQKLVLRMKKEAKK